MLAFSQKKLTSKNSTPQNEQAHLLIPTEVSQKSISIDVAFPSLLPKLLALLIVVSGIAGCATSQGPSISNSGWKKLEAAHYALNHSDFIEARRLYQEVASAHFPPLLRGQALYGLGECELQEYAKSSAGVKLVKNTHSNQQISQMQKARRYFRRARPLLSGDRSLVPLQLGIVETHLYEGAHESARLGLEKALAFLSYGAERNRANLLLALIYESRSDFPKSSYYSSLAQGSASKSHKIALRQRFFPKAIQSPAIASKSKKAVKKAPQLSKTPRVLPRRVWNAKKAGFSKQKMNRIFRLTIHHTGEVKPPSFKNQAEVGSYIRRLQNNHQKKGWADIGYHYIVDRFGSVYEGRSIRYQGAHAGNPKANKGNIGVVLLGNFNFQHPSKKQKESLANLVSWLCKKYKISRREVHTHQYIRLRAGLATTDCPGSNLMKMLPKLLGEIPYQPNDINPAELVSVGCICSGCSD